MSETKNKNKYKFIIDSSSKNNKKLNPCNQINKYINKYNPKNKIYYSKNINTSNQELRYLTNSDVYCTINNKIN